MEPGTVEFFGSVGCFDAHGHHIFPNFFFVLRVEDKLRIVKFATIKGYACYAVEKEPKKIQRKMRGGGNDPVLDPSLNTVSVCQTGRTVVRLVFSTMKSVRIMICPTLTYDF